MGRALRSHLANQLPTYMLPTAYQVLDAFPLTPNGKIDKNALPGIAPLVVTPDNQPKTALETTLAEIWRSLLQLDAVGIHDNFFEVGGHSLLVVNAQSQIRQKLGIELSLMDLFRYPTLSTLATYISQIQTGEPEEKAADRAMVRVAGKQRLRQRLQQRQKLGTEVETLGGTAQ